MVDNLITSGTMLAAARTTNGEGGQQTLFTIIFDVAGDATGDYPISIVSSIIENEAAGYSTPTTVPMLVGIDSESTPVSFPSITPSIIPGSLTVGMIDTDGDGLNDDTELNMGTDPNLADSDGDGLNDGEEFEYWGDNWNGDADADGLINILDSDADNDGYLDGDEVSSGTSPGDPVSYPGSNVFFDDFSSDTRVEYTVDVDCEASSFNYDSTGQRLHLLTGDDTSLCFYRSLPALSSGTFSFDFLPTRKYPVGGVIAVWLYQDDNNYYQIVYADGYDSVQIEKVVNGVVVESQAAATQYSQNNDYHVAIDFSPEQLAITAFGVVQTLGSNNSDIQVVGFEIELAQQDGYLDNIYYSNNTIPADTEPPIWDTTTGIVSALDTGTGGSVTVSFGAAADAVDGANVNYNVYYAPSSSWNTDWSLNNVVVATAGPVTISGLSNDVQYTFGVRVADQNGNEDGNTNILAATPTFTGGSSFFDDFSSDTTAEYTVVDGGTGSFNYDGTGQRLHVLTGDNNELLISRPLPAFSSGTFSFDFLPIQKYPLGGVITIRLVQDENNYYEIVYSDGYDYGQINNVVNGVTVESQAAATQYSQNNTYPVEVNFSPGQLTVTAFGVVQNLASNSSAIQVAGFEIQLGQQDGYLDNIYYSGNTIPADTEPPIWDTMTGIVSALDTGTDGSVTVSFGAAADAVDGANVNYNIYYATSSSWNTHWSSNNVVVASAGPVTLGGLTNDVQYTFGVRVADQSGNEDSNTNILTVTPTFTGIALRVNAGGGEYTDSNGDIWSADYGYNTGNKSSKSVAISGTEDDALFQTQRWDSNSGEELKYSFDVPNGDYVVNLYFAENYTGVFRQGGRVFDILLEGYNVEHNFDIYSVAGANAAHMRSYEVSVVDGQLNLEFLHGVENPTISAIGVFSY
jgi:hypothetical protein